MESSDESKKIAQELWLRRKLTEGTLGRPIKILNSLSNILLIIGIISSLFFFASASGDNIYYAGIGIGVLISSIITCYFLKVICSIAENLIEIFILLDDGNAWKKRNQLQE